MKSIKLKSLLLFPLLAGALIGCGTQNSNNKSETQSSGDSSGGTPAVSTVKIKFWHTFGQTVVDGLKNQIDKFEKLVKDNDNVDVTVELSYQGSYDDIAQKIDKGYSVNNKPTIAVAYPDNVSDYIDIGKSAGEDFVINLDKFINDNSVGFGAEKWLGDKYDEDDFVEAFFEEGSRYTKEGTYSLPFMKSSEIMFYNMDLVNETMRNYNPALFGSPTKIEEYMKNITWDEFIELSTYIAQHKADISSNIVVPFAYDSDANLFITKLYQNNIGYASINSAGKGSIDFGSGDNRAKTIALLEDAQALYQNGIFKTKKTNDNKYSSSLFTAEKCVFCVGSSGGSGYNFPQGGSFDMAVCRVPASNNNPLYVTQGPTLALFHDNGLDAKVSEATELYAWKFLKFITNGEVNAELCTRGSEGYIPVRYSAYETSIFTTFMEQGEDYAACNKVVINDIKGKYFVAPAFKGSASLRDKCELLFSSVLTASKDQIPTLLDNYINQATLDL